ncbi:MAG: hypothetical protein AAB511_00720 [Patescibacteria group bacterium]
MYIPYLVLLIISFVGIIFILVNKILEIKNGSTSSLTALSSSFDPQCRNTIEKSRLFLSRINVANLKKILATIAHSIFHVFGTAGLFVSKHHKRLTNRLDGKRELNGRGVVSFFLKHVKESKEENDKNNS